MLSAGTENYIHGHSQIKPTCLLYMGQRAWCMSRWTISLPIWKCIGTNHASFCQAPLGISSTFPPFKDGYALGWGVEKDGRLSHNGSNGMWMTSVSIDKRSGLVFSAALNAATPESQSVLDQAAESALLSRKHPK